MDRREARGHPYSATPTLAVCKVPTPTGGVRAPRPPDLQPPGEAAHPAGWSGALEPNSRAGSRGWDPGEAVPSTPPLPAALATLAPCHPELSSPCPPPHAVVIGSFSFVSRTVQISPLLPIALPAGGPGGVNNCRPSSLDQPGGTWRGGGCHQAWMPITLSVPLPKPEPPPPTAARIPRPLGEK